MAAVRSKIAALARSPLVWILCGVFVLHGVGIGWGLPSDDGWDDDGVAPRDFLVGVVQTFTPGKYYTYPPAHVILLALLTSPIWLRTLLRAPSLSPAVLVPSFTTVPIMTTFSLVARTTSLAMSLGIVFALARVADEVRPGRAGLAVAAVVSLNAPFAYYSHTSNLDVPCAFWACFALLHFVRAIARREPHRMRAAAVLAALSIATKDQAAALYLLGAPLALAAWFACDEWARRHARALVTELFVSAVIALALVLVVDGALVNPSGFRARLAYLLGSASQDYAGYASTWSGRLAIVRNALAEFPRFYPWPFALLGLVGLRRATTSKEPARRAAAMVPFFFAVSFFVLFNCLARRTDERFLLPQSLVIGVYAGIGLGALIDGAPHWLRPLAFAGALGLFLWGLFDCAAVDANLVLDPRYAAENWLNSHVRPGDTLEVYGNQVYLPRLPSKARISRVDRRPIDQRNPLAGAFEIDAPFEEVDRRSPQWIVLTDSQVWPYLVSADEFRKTGRTFPPGQRSVQGDESARAYFRDLIAGRRGYEVAHVSTWHSTIWPRFRIHGSTGEEICILERSSQP